MKSYPQMALLAATIFLSGAASVFSQTVRFDVPASAEGREVSNIEFQSLHPSEKLVTFSWELAADFGFSTDESVAAIALQIHTLDPEVTIHDFSPRSVADSEIDGTIEVEKIDEKSSGWGLQADTGSLAGWHAGANANTGGKTGKSLRYDQKPEQRLQISSGLMNRGAGLSIKLHRTPQQPLDGMHPIQLTLRMPLHWRSGFLRVECEAIHRKESLLNEPALASAGRRSYLLPIYIEGDEEARLQARAVRQSEKKLRATVNSKIRPSQTSSVFSEFSRWAQPDKKATALSPQWLERVTNTIAPQADENPTLPRDVSIALKDYQRHLQTFVQLAPTTRAESVVMQQQTWSSKKTQ